MNTKIINWDAIVIVEPGLWGIEKTSLTTFEYGGSKIEFKENKGNPIIDIHGDFYAGEIKRSVSETVLGIRLRSKEENLLTEIDALMIYFLGRFELYGNCSYSYKLGKVINLTNSSIELHGQVTISKPIDAEDEKYITKIDKIAELLNGDKITHSISEFHHAKMAISPNHAYLSITNAIYPLIEYIGKQERTHLSGLNAPWILFNMKIIKEEREKDDWIKDLKWIHKTIDDIRYHKLKVTKKDVEKIQTLYKKFLDMYIIYKQQRE